MTILVALSALAVLALHLVLLVRVRGRTRERENLAKEGEALSRALIRNSPRGIHMYELDSGDALVFSGYNPSADRILGIDHSALLGKRIEEAFPPLAATEIPARYLAAARDGIPWSTEQVEYEDKTVKGAFEIVAFQTRPRAMAVVFSDITERRRADERLRALNEELERQKAYMQTLLDGLPGIFYLYEYPGLRLVAWNRNHETALGFANEEMRGRDLREWHIPEAKGAVVEAVDRCMREGEASIEAPLVAKDGRRIPYLLTGTAFHAEGQDYLMGVGIDISERVAAEEKLRVLNQELEDRVAFRTRQLSEANAALEEALVRLKDSQAKMLVTEKMASLGQLVSSLAHELNTPLGAILSAAGTNALETSFLRETLTLYRSLDEDEARAFDFLGSVFTTEGEWDRAEERKARKRYEAVLEEGGLPGSALLAERLSELSPDLDGKELAARARLPRFAALVEAAHHTASILRSDYVIGLAARKVALVVDALRTYARSAQAEGLEAADPEAQIDNVLLILENRWKGKVEIDRRYAEVPPVPCRPERLAQVWMNLLTNALHALAGKGRIEIATRSENGRVIVSVTDDGPGIPEAIQPRIFEPFFTTKPSGEGLGLGLDIARRILEDIGASIDFESRPGRTRFTVSLKTGKEEEG